MVPDGTEIIGPRQYFKNSCEYVFIPNSVVAIKESAFQECENLRVVVFEEGSRLRTIGENAFYNCAKLRSSELPSGLRKIGARCFWGCGIAQLSISASVKEIGAEAFYGCKKLKSVQLNEGLEKLGAKEIVNG